MDHSSKLCVTAIFLKERIKANIFYRCVITDASLNFKKFLIRSLDQMFDYLEQAGPNNKILNILELIKDNQHTIYKFRVFFNKKTQQGQLQKIHDFDMEECIMSEQEIWKTYEQKRKRELKAIIDKNEVDKKLLLQQQQQLKEQMIQKQIQYKEIFSQFFGEVLQRLEQKQIFRNKKNKKQKKRHREAQKQFQQQEFKTKQSFQKECSEKKNKKASVLNEINILQKLDNDPINPFENNFVPFDKQQINVEKITKKKKYKQPRKQLFQLKKLNSINNQFEQRNVLKEKSQKKQIESISFPVQSNNRLQYSQTQTKTNDEFNPQYNGVSRYNRRKQNKLFTVFNKHSLIPSSTKDNIEVIPIGMKFVLKLESCRHFEWQGAMLRKKSGVNYQQMVFDCPLISQGKYTITMRVVVSKRMYIWLGVVDAKKIAGQLLYTKPGTICFSLRTGTAVTSCRWSKQKLGRFKEGQTVRMDIDRENMAIHWFLSDGRVAVSDIPTHVRKLTLMPYFELMDIGDIVQFQQHM